MITIYTSSKKEIKAKFHDLDPMDIFLYNNYICFFEDAIFELLNKISYNYEEQKHKKQIIIDFKTREMLFLFPDILFEKLRIK